MCCRSLTAHSNLYRCNEQRIQLAKSCANARRLAAGMNATEGLGMGTCKPTDKVA